MNVENCGYILEWIMILIALSLGASVMLFAWVHYETEKRRDIRYRELMKRRDIYNEVSDPHTV